MKPPKVLQAARLRAVEDGWPRRDISFSGRALL